MRQLLGAEAPHPAPAHTATGAGRSAARSGVKGAPQRRQLPVEEQGPRSAPARPRTCPRARAQQPHCVREARRKQRDLESRHCDQREHDRRPVQPPRVPRVAAHEGGCELRCGRGDHQLVQQRPREQVAALPQGLQAGCRGACTFLLRGRVQHQQPCLEGWMQKNILPSAAQQVG